MINLVSLSGPSRRRAASIVLVFLTISSTTFLLGPKVSAQTSSTKYVLSWQGYDWDGGHEETIYVNGNFVVSLPPTGVSSNGGAWASFSLNITSFVVQGANALRFTHAGWDCGVSDNVRDLQITSGSTVVYSNSTTLPLSCTQSLTYTFTTGMPPPPPLASSFTYSPTSPSVGQTITFTASSSGGVPPYSYSWNFGDGSTGLGGSVTHSYSSLGTFTVTMTVKDSASPITNSLTTTKSITTTGTQPGDFSIYLSRNNATIYPGAGSLLANVGANFVNGFTGTVTFSTSAPAAFTGTLSISPPTFDPTSLGPSDLDISNTNSLALGTYNITVIGTSGSLTHSTLFTLVVANPDFTIFVSPKTQSVVIGQGPGYGVELTGVNSFYGSITLTVASSSSMSCEFITATSSGTTVTVSLPFGSASVGLSCSTSGPSGTYTGTVTGTSGSVIHSTTFSVTVMDFGISATNVSFAAGSSGSSTVTVTGLFGFAGNLSLTVSTPPGLTGTCPSSVLVTTGSASSASCKFSAMSPGVYNANITAFCNNCDHSGQVSHTATLSVTVSQQSDFHVTVTPNNGTINRGFSGVFSSVAVGVASNFNGTFTLAVTSDPGLAFSIFPSTVTFSNGFATCGCVSELDGTISNTVAFGTYKVNVTATFGSLTRSAVLTLIVAPSDFTMTLGESSQSIPLDGSAQTVVSLVGVNGFYANVNLVVASSSSVNSCQFASNANGTPLGTSTTVGLQFGSAAVNLLCTALSPGGVYNATVTGTSGSLIHTNVFTVTIMDYMISATEVSFVAGSSGNSTVTATSLHGLFGTMSLGVSTPSGLTGVCQPSLSFASGGSSTAQCRFTSLTPGTYVANITATFQCNISCGSSGMIVHSAASSVTVSPGELPLTASFSFSPSNPTANQPVTFTATASGGVPPYAFRWNFGDSTTGSVNPVIHAYSAQGTYTVNLTVIDTASPTSNNRTVTESVTISPPPPPPPLHASFTYSPTSPAAGQIMTLSANATGGVSPYSYSWNFGDSSTGIDQFTSHSYSNQGNYSVTVTVSDSESPSRTVTSTRSVVVSAPPPLTISFSYLPSKPVAGSPVTFTSSETGGVPPYSLSWNFGDGTTGVSGSAGHTYISPGTYTVVFIVNDSASPHNTQTTSQTIIVSPSPSSTYNLSWQGYDWDGGHEETITLNGHVVARLPAANSPQNGGAWASFSLNITSFVVKGTNTLTFTHANWDCGTSDNVRNLQVTSGTTVIYSNPNVSPLSCTQTLTYTFTV